MKKTHAIFALLLASCATIANATLISTSKNVSGASMDMSELTIASTANVLFSSPSGRILVRNHVNLEEDGILRSNAQSHANGSLSVSASSLEGATMNLRGIVRNEYAGGDFILSAVDGAKIYVASTSQFEGNIAFDIYDGSLQVENGANLALSHLNLGKNGGNSAFAFSSGTAAIKSLSLASDTSGTSVGKSGTLTLSGTAAIVSAGGGGANIGTSSADAAGADQSESVFKIIGSAKYSTDAAFNVKSSGTIVLAPDQEKATEMLSASSIDFQREANNIGNALVIDGAALQLAGDTFYTALIRIEDGGTLSLNGTESVINIDSNTTVFQIRDFCEDNDLIVFENFDEDVWGIVGINNIVWDADSGIIGIFLAPIPEPAAYAAVFGVLALALAAYRRRK